MIEMVTLDQVRGRLLDTSSWGNDASMQGAARAGGPPPDDTDAVLRVDEFLLGVSFVLEHRDRDGRVVARTRLHPADVRFYTLPDGQRLHLVHQQERDA